MRKLGYFLSLFIIILMLTCCAKQLQSIKKKVVDTSTKVLGAIAQGYGGAYSGLVQSFFKLVGGGDDKEKEGEYYTQGEYYQGGGDYYGQDPYYQGAGQPPGDYYQGGYYREGQAPPPGSYPAQESYPPGQGGGQQQGDYYQGGYYQDAPSPPPGSYPPQQSYPPGQGAGQAPGGYYQATYPQQLEVAIDLVREINVGGRFEARPVMDGETLTRQDNYKVTFQCNMTCYIYIAQLDSTGKLDPIFPGQFASWTNPVNPNTFHTIPPGDIWFFLDENVGRETIYFIASRTRRPDIEDLFRQFETTNRDLMQLTPVSLNESYIITRGIGGTRKGREHLVQFQDGSQGQYVSTLISSIRADFVTTRWFEHR